MTMLKTIGLTYVTFVIAACLSGLAHASNEVEALILEQLFDATAASYPSLIAAKIEAQASTEDVVAMERISWPAVSATIESYTGNTRSIPSRGVQVDQTVWDFGRNTAKISETQLSADASLLKTYLQQQDVFLQVIAAWQNMISANERLKVAKLTVNRLKNYQSQMRRRVAAEASAPIDLELADSRLIQTEVEQAAAENNLQVALMRLEQFSGMSNLLRRVEDARYPVTLFETQLFNEKLRGVDWRVIASNHPASAKSRIEVVQFQKRLEAKKAEALPQIFVRMYKPIGVIPSSSDTSTTAFLGLRYAPGAGLSTYAEAKAISTRINSAEESVEAAIREMQQTLQSDHEEFLNARIRLGALEKSVASSALVLESYQRQFQAGRKQWQDLLNQVRELAQNQYALADAQAAMVGAMYRLRVRMGDDRN
jgi:adhesin transport system outer membrane protein